MIRGRHHFEPIESSSARRSFKHRYETCVRERSKGRIETTVEEAYLERARVTGLFDARGELVGGFVINATSPLLLLGPLPPAVREDWLARHPEPTQCELVAIWKAPAISQAVSAMVLWPRIVHDCVRMGRSHILGLGYDNRMNEIYGIARPVRIYAGPRADKPQLQQHVSVYAFTPLSITLTYCTNVVTELLFEPARRMARKLRAQVTR
ncbi:hypothetical protein [Paraliomyxa miuraensis]|uniref:hypothetical protein n=1 Tax=Paraliomyxa miuraensis TaxID=376150 RepID=UPI0022566FDF|nr:hypothetical protein [Paraliomyxa miuraensis]MCX4246553.1 hypothetical protein [Paraliomyxa miuraensis]